MKVKIFISIMMEKVGMQWLVKDGLVVGAFGQSFTFFGPPLISEHHAVLGPSDFLFRLRSI